MARLPRGPNTLTPRALCTVAPARARAGLKLEARRTRGVSRYGDLAHAVHTLSSAGLERRDATATRPSVVARDPRVVRWRPAGVQGRPAGGARRDPCAAWPGRPRHHHRAAARAQIDREPSPE